MANPELPQVQWLGPAENPWGVPVLDVRPVTLGMLSTSRDQQCAVNAMSFGQDDGTGFIGVEPRVTRQVTAGLQFRIDRMLADGALFLPQEMEIKNDSHVNLPGGTSWKSEAISCRVR
jgi:hypothetical protein